MGTILATETDSHRCNCPDCPARKPLHPVVAWMEGQRQRLGLGHGQFVALLGVSDALWYQYRHGQKKPSGAMQARLMQLWPEQEADIVAVVRTLPWKKRSGDA